MAEGPWTSFHVQIGHCSAFLCEQLLPESSGHHEEHKRLPRVRRQSMRLRSEKVREVEGCGIGSGGVSRGAEKGADYVTEIGGRR